MHIFSVIANKIKIWDEIKMHIIYYLNACSLLATIFQCMSLCLWNDLPFHLTSQIPLRNHLETFWHDNTIGSWLKETYYAPFYNM